MVKVLEVLVRADPGTHGTDVEAEEHATNGANGGERCMAVLVDEQR